MKKLIAVALIICFLPSCAFAIDLTPFNTFCYLFGEEMFDESTGVEIGLFILYTAKGCTIGFKQEDDAITQIFVKGKGDPFIAYSMAAIMSFTEDLGSLTDDAGMFLFNYLLSRSGNEKQGTIKTGETFIIRPDDDGFFFTVGK